MADPIVSLASILAQFSQNVQELSAHLRNAGDTAAQQVNGYYREAKRAVRAFDEQRGLRYRPAAISFSVALVGPGSANAGNESFRVAQNEDFLVQSVRGWVINNNLPADPGGAALANPLTTTLTPSEVLLAKANNCRVTLQNKDTKVPYTENESIPLSSIMPEVGGMPLVFGPDAVPGFLVPHNTTIQALFALQSTNLLFNTASTQYGVTLSGLYLSREVR